MAPGDDPRVEPEVDGAGADLRGGDHNIKRSIRDLYTATRGDLGRRARTGFAPRLDFMRQLIPSQAGRDQALRRSEIRCSTPLQAKWRSTPCTRLRCNADRRLPSSSIRPRRWSPSTSLGRSPRSATSRRRRCAPTWRRPTKSPAQVRLRDLWPSGGDRLHRHGGVKHQLQSSGA